MKKMALQKTDLTKRGSFWNHVNILSNGEEWPSFRGELLFPVVQLKCADIDLPDTPLAEFSFVTLFAIAGDLAASLGENSVICAYRRDDKLVTVEPPCDPLETPRMI